MPVIRERVPYCNFTLVLNLVLLISILLDRFVYLGLISLS